MEITQAHSDIRMSEGWLLKCRCVDSLLVCVSYFTDHRQPVTVCEMSINLLKSVLFCSGNGSGKVIRNPYPGPDTIKS